MTARFLSSLSIGGPIISYRPWGSVFVICDSTSVLVESVDRWTFNITQTLGFCVCHLWQHVSSRVCLIVLKELRVAAAIKSSFCFCFVVVFCWQSDTVPTKMKTWTFCHPGPVSYCFYHGPNSVYLYRSMTFTPRFRIVQCLLRRGFLEVVTLHRAG